MQGKLLAVNAAVGSRWALFRGEDRFAAALDVDAMLILRSPANPELNALCPLDSLIP